MTQILTVRKNKEVFDFFMDGTLVQRAIDEKRLPAQLSLHGLLDDECQDMLARLRETGEATLELPSISFRQI